MKGPAEWFTGDVYMDSITAPTNGSRLNATSVHFTPGARTAWHTHPNGQTLYVTEGVGRSAGSGGDVKVIRPGDRVFFTPGENHWHGASPTRFMTHVSMVEADDEGNSATWGSHVSDEEYGANPAGEE
jgi:quercetin dioxygenase-like cupin family protein